MKLHNRWQRFIILSLACIGVGNTQTTFRDDFTAPPLDPAWLTRPGIGAYSLTDNPGYLRYNLTGSTHPDKDALWIYRPFSGTEWTLETKVSYDLPYGNGRQFRFRAVLGDLTQAGVNEVLWHRTSDQAGGGPDVGEVYVNIIENANPISTHFLVTYPQDTHFVQVRRSGQDVSLWMSPDGITWSAVLQHTFGTPLGSLQNVLLEGWNFAGSGYADYDYIEVIQDADVTCVGFEPPMENGPVLVKKNRVLPLKAQLFKDGDALSDADIAAPVVEVTFDAGTGPEPVLVEALAVGLGDDGNQFVFTEEGKWQFNLSTKPYTAPGTYMVSMKPGSPEYRLNPACSVQFVIR